MPLMLRFGLLCITFVLCIGHIAYAQMAVSPSDVSVGEIRLQVNDPSGAGLRAIGNLTGSGTNRTFQTDVQGAFSLSGLAFGRYELRISRSGFVSRIVTVHVNSPAPVSLKVTLLVQGTSTNIAVFSPTPINTDNVSFTLVPIFLDGTTFDDGNAVDTQVLLHGTVNTPSIYATDTFTYGPWAATLSGRYNHTSLDNLDYLSPSAARGNLTSYNVFQRFNPAAGFTYKPSRLFNAYFNYSEASRSPTSIELGCSDPTAPCNLPNALVSDPPLKQVVSRTIEVGIRSNENLSLHWSADYFFGQNYNDLLFVASEQTGFGYFLNFGKTRRDGLELEISEDWRHWSVGSNYTFMNATYQSPQTIDGGSNSTNDSALAGEPGIDDNIHIVPGDFIPQVPRSIFKLYGQYHPSPKLTAEMDILAVGSSFARGNENNLDQPDGIYYLGPRKSAGYGIGNLGVRYQITNKVQLIVQMNNLLDKHYSTGAQLGTTPFDNNNHFVAQPFGTPYGDDDVPIRSSSFQAPGTPFNIYGGLKITLWKK